MEIIYHTLLSLPYAFLLIKCNKNSCEKIIELDGEKYKVIYIQF